MNIILFGGAFNPVHSEHVAMLKAAQNSIGAQKTIIMPTAVSPHKSGKMSASAAARLEMCRLAFEGLGEVSDYEISRGGASYSYITCEYLKAEYPDAKIYFLMGADMLECFSAWKYPERILACVTPAMCARVSDERAERIFKDFNARYGDRAVRVNYTGAAVSSTRVRVAAALGADISQVTPKAVCEYIKDKELYIKENLVRAQSLLKPERAAHTLRVAFMAAENCGRAGIEEEKAVTAAALHDAAKYLKLSDSMLKGFKPPEGVPESVMHQFTGAYIAEHEFGITDEDVLDAIRYHTSGRPNMSALEKLIFLCDMLEEGRDFKGVDNLRAAFARDIDECLYLALKEQTEYLKSSGKPIYPLTEQAYEYAKAQKK